jgi:hypothetical protein
MKTKPLFAALAAVALFALALPVLGQGSFDQVAIVNGGTNHVAASTTITSGTAGGGVSLARVDSVGLLITQTPYATNVQANVVYTFARGISAANVETAGSLTVTIPTSTNATTQSYWTNWSVPGVGYLKLVSIANAANVAITNLTITAVRKAPATVSLTR